ncbi:MAG: flavin reductase family protein [Bauldia sp.]|nr:flavin reductase family protein [Bauldia sp.]
MNEHPRPPVIPDAARHDAFRGAMRSLAGAVSVITAGFGDERSGLTATSVSSLSIDPPTLIACINRNASTWPLIQRHRHFGVNVLAPHHEVVADRFAGRHGVKGAARYAGADWLELVTGAPILADAVVAIDCELEEAIDRHSHSIVIGRVRAIHAGLGDADAALIYWRGAYGAVTHHR